uniref:AAA family ATPase n=1 Tax=Gemmatimonas sp. TaxID=1962908 RepID=UPI0037C135C2
MKLSFVEIEGFRGVRSLLRVDIPDGFLVITGRNGSGKSTLCDAIEFALTGALSKHDTGSERGESMDQYIWWRGTAPAVRNRVRVGIHDSDGREFVVSRTPDGLQVEGLADTHDLEAALCDRSVMSRDPLKQLCRTAIIRDETLAAMSVDQSEFDRFAFVRTALGTDALDDVTRRGKDILAMLKKDVEAANAAYEKARDEVARLLAELARERSQASEVPDTAAAEGEVRRRLGADAPAEPSRLLAAARQRVATL